MNTGHSRRIGEKGIHVRSSHYPASLLVTAFGLGLTAITLADTRLVPSEYATIQAAIDAAGTGDVVEITDGTYTGVGNKNLDFGGKAITVRSASGDPNACIIDCEQHGRGFYFHSGEDPNSIVSGLTITNGDVVSSGVGGNYGGAILCKNASRPTVLSCILSENSASLGGGVYCYSESNLTLSNCTISGNSAEAVGGGVFGSRSDPTLSNCIIVKNSSGKGGGVGGEYSNLNMLNCLLSGNLANSGGGVSIDFYSNPILTNCTITGNIASSEGGGVICLRSDPAFYNCTVNGNLAGSTGGGGGLNCWDSSPVLTNCVVWDNTPDAIYSRYCNLIVNYCIVQNGSSQPWFGEGCIDIDPQLTPNGHLMANSPCINAGAADGVPNEQHDRDGELRIQQGQVDIGSDEWLDSDDDDLPDWWEKLYFDDPESAEPFGDDDEDGVDSLGEYESGRDPGWEPQAYYVTLVGDDVWDGLSPIWDGIHGPKATIQAAIDTCHPYEGDEVVIASGAFKGEGNKNLDFKGKAITLRSTSKDPNLCIIDCESSGRGFNFHSGEGQNSIVSGLTIANGLVVGSGRGGGVYCRVRSSPMLSNCIIKDCDAYYGGGLHCHDDCNPTLVNCTITGNSSSYGGGVYCYRSKVALFNCIVAENSTGSGGGIYCTSSEPIVADSTITGNSAVYGGGAYCDSKLNLSNCQVMGNTATEEGGGVYLTSHSLLSNCTISGNSATKGGGVYSYLNDPTISYCTIVENSATIGGGVCSNVSDLTLLNCLISGNTTRDNGGGIYCSGSQPSFINCTVAANSAGLNGGGVYCKICYLTLNNCIVSSNFPDAVSVSSGNPIITHCAVESGTGQSWFGAGCIDADPRFVDPDGPTTIPIPGRTTTSTCSRARPASMPATTRPFQLTSMTSMVMATRTSRCRSIWTA